MSYNQSFFKSLKDFLYHFLVLHRPFSTSIVTKCQNILHPYTRHNPFSFRLISFTHTFIWFFTFSENIDDNIGFLLEILVVEILCNTTIDLGFVIFNIVHLNSEGIKKNSQTVSTCIKMNNSREMTVYIFFLLCIQKSPR